MLCGLAARGWHTTQCPRVTDSDCELLFGRAGSALLEPGRPVPAPPAPGPATRGSREMSWGTGLPRWGVPWGPCNGLAGRPLHRGRQTAVGQCREPALEAHRAGASGGAVPAGPSFPENTRPPGGQTRAGLVPGALLAFRPWEARAACIRARAFSSCWRGPELGWQGSAGPHERALAGPLPGH